MMKQTTAGSLILAMMISLASCGSSQPKPEPEVYFSSIALASPKDLLDAMQPQTRGEKAKKGAATGSVGGLAAGTGIGAITCGPFLYGLCVMALASAGTLAGGASGALYGFTGFPKDAAKKLERNVEALSREHDLQSVLVDHIRQNVPPEMLAKPQMAEIQAVLTVENLEFEKEEKKVHLVSTVRVTFESNESRRVPEYGYKVFTGKSEEFELRNWLDNNSDDLREAIKQSLLEVADKIVKLLNARWRPQTD